MVPGLRLLLGNQEDVKPFQGCRVQLVQRNLEADVDDRKVKHPGWCVFVPQYQTYAFFSEIQLKVPIGYMSHPSDEGHPYSFLPSTYFSQKNRRYDHIIDGYIRQFWEENSFHHPMNRSVIHNDDHGRPQSHIVRLLKHEDREASHKAFQQQ